MPIYRNTTIFKIARNIKAFLDLQAGVVRGNIPEQIPQLQEKVKQPRRQEEESTQLRATLAENRDTPTPHIRPENLIWMFGAGRSGSTWLAAMINDLSEYRWWDEPLVGLLFGNLYYVQAPLHVEKRAEQFILGKYYRDSWLNSIKTFVLSEAVSRYTEINSEDFLVIKEPNGSVGAPLLMEAMPESRMILLVRDPRDVVASFVDARSEGAWLSRWSEREALVVKNPTQFVKGRAQNYLLNVGKARKAYENHKGPRTLVRYEELRTDTLRVMKRTFSELDLPVEESQLERVVEEHSWSNIPNEEKGEGKFYRKAKPGGWQEDLTPEQVTIVEEITAPLLKEFYPG